ncbi:MAG: glycogen synthase GlgA [Syntrophomonadaceae bacterium]|nr:glycogen synthase GlgA [Syntrophomonadaceae bacterium]
MKILIAASEMTPFAKTGGLADVTGSLPKALKDLGHDVRVVIPNYKQITAGRYLTDLPVPMDGHLETAIIRHASIKGKYEQIPVYLADNHKYFHRDRMYGFNDEFDRFNFFTKTCLAMLPYLGFQPDVIHCNDWHTALIPLFLKNKFGEEPFYKNIASVFTVHNLQYQGRFPKRVLTSLGLDDSFFTPEELEYYGEVNFMKAGLLHGDLINTVSRKYAAEIQTHELGEGLDGLLRKRALDLHGILNGLDYQEFDPVQDEKIYVKYDVNSLENKRENKYQLQKSLGLSMGDVPMVGIITRLVSQKGLDLMAAVIDEIMGLGIQLVLLGTGEDYYEKLFAEVKVRYPQQTSVNLGFDAALAQKIYAGSDIFLMPSRFEPCGLGQLISLRYGTIPVVRRTGGLADTITNYDFATGYGNGFDFVDYSPEELLGALSRAVQLYRNNPDAWGKLIHVAMNMDFSWNRSAVKYLELYEKAINKRKSSMIRAG